MGVATRQSVANCTHAHAQSHMGQLRVSFCTRRQIYALRTTISLAHEHHNETQSHALIRSKIPIQNHTPLITQCSLFHHVNDNVLNLHDLVMQRCNI